MFSSKRVKFVCPVFLASVIFSSCSFWQTSENGQSNSNKFVASELESSIPFENKEPEVFQAEIVLSSFLNGEKIERVIKAARSKEKVRYDYPNGTSFLQKDENERFLLETEKKIYAQNSTISDSSKETGETLKDFLTTEWLNGKSDVKFEKIGAENGLTKYLVKGENEGSETLIYFDENLKLPVKQEFYVADGGQKNIISAMELRNLKLEVDEMVFELPKGFRQVSIKEFQQIVREKKN